MINLKVGSEIFQLQNEANEITLKDFNKIYTILQLENLSYHEKYCEIFKSLGLPESVLDDILDSGQLGNLIKNFNAIEISNDLPAKSIEIKGYTYVAYEGDEFKFKIKDLIAIEKCAKRGVTNFPSFILAVIFKRSDLTVNEHYEMSHLNLKAKLFEENMFTDFAIPYIALVASRTLNSLQSEKLD